MAKKKSKKKHRKIAQDRSKQTGQDLVGSSIKNVGIMLVSLLIGQIVEAAIERLLHKVPSPTPATETAEPAQNGSDGQEMSRPIAHPLESSALMLQNEMGASQIGVKDVVEAVRAAVRDVTPTLDDVVDVLTASTWQSVQQAVGTAGNTTKTAVVSAVSSAKTLIDKLNSSDTDGQSKSGKKKRKKNKKK